MNLVGLFSADLDLRRHDPSFPCPGYNFVVDFSRERKFVSCAAPSVAVQWSVTSIRSPPIGPPPHALRIGTPPGLGFEKFEKFERFVEFLTPSVMRSPLAMISSKARGGIPHPARKHSLREEGSRLHIPSFPVPILDNGIPPASVAQ